MANKIMTPDYLRQQARWIRDTLDPQVAQTGPDALHSDEILTLDELLRHLMDNTVISIDDIRYSRIHRAILEISGRATRWPKKLIDRSKTLQDVWEAKFGPLKSLGILLYEPGGRLNGVCEPSDLSKARLMMKWLKSPGVKVSPAVARKTGDLGFKPGDWWISPLFAYHAGIIDSANLESGIVSDNKGAYAVIMTGGDEIPGFDPNSFKYHAKSRDPGRYRLTAGTPESRHPIRILRHHSLQTLFKPRAGLRYDGLHKVTGWTICKCTAKPNSICYSISFKRLASEIPMTPTVLARPWAEEIEDYTEYKLIRQQRRQAQTASMPSVTLSSLDGIDDTDLFSTSSGEVIFTPSTSSGESEAALACALVRTELLENY